MSRAELSSGRHAMRHPLDWYVEEEWVTRQLIEAMGHFRMAFAAGDTIWDPACGRGTIGGAFSDMAAFWAENHDRRLILSDVCSRLDPDLLGDARYDFFSADFLEVERAPACCSIVSNPPYSYCKGHGDYGGQIISEAFARHAIELVRACGGRHVCLLLPLKWLAPQSRYRLCAEEAPPAHVLILTQRPSMPPGDRIAAMGNRAFRGGMIDYGWVVWNVQRPTAPGGTRLHWLPPLGRPVSPILEEMTDAA